MSCVFNIQELPYLILEKIASSLQVKDLNSLRLTCKTLESISLCRLVLKKVMVRFSAVDESKDLDYALQFMEKLNHGKFVRLNFVPRAYKDFMELPGDIFNRIIFCSNNLQELVCYIDNISSTLKYCPSLHYLKIQIVNGTTKCATYSSLVNNIADITILKLNISRRYHH